MTPADTIRPIARLVDQAHPDLKIVNTRASCYQLLAMIAKAAGPDFAFVGKTATMDGEGKFTPPGFQPLTMALLRDDGETQTVTIVGVSMDALWYLPTMRQVKVIVNSTDGEPGGQGKPARLDSYDIEPIKDGQRQYRWFNPPIAQSLIGQTPDAPKPPVVVPPSNILPKGEAFTFLKALDAFYRAPEGLQRPEGIGGDMEAIAQWFYQGVIEGKSIDDVQAQIRQSDEWKAKHP